MTEDSSRSTRRKVLKRTTVAAGTVAFAGVTTWYGSQPAVAAHVDQWTAGGTDVVQSDDGQLAAVYTEPTIEIEWRNFSAGADSVDVALTAYLPDTATNGHVDGSKTDTVFDEAAISSTDTAGVVGIEDVANDHDGGFDTVNGGVRITLDQFDITNGGDIAEGDFSDESSDTGSQETEVDLELQTVVNGAQSTDPSAVQMSTFTVEVENLDETTTVGGDAGTSAE